MTEIIANGGRNAAVEGTPRLAAGLVQRPRASQSDLVFDTIANQALMLRAVLANLRHQPERHRDLDTLFGDLALAEALTNQIGALADQMVGGRVVGCLGAWVVGPAFEHDPLATSK